MSLKIHANPHHAAHTVIVAKLAVMPFAHAFKTTSEHHQIAAQSVLLIRSVPLINRALIKNVAIPVREHAVSMHAVRSSIIIRFVVAATAIQAIPLYDVYSNVSITFNFHFHSHTKIIANRKK